MIAPLPLNPLNSLDDWRHAAPPAAAREATLAAMRNALPQARRPLGGVLHSLQGARWLAWSGIAACATGVLGIALVFSVSLPPTQQREFSASAFVPLVSSERWQRVIQETQEPTKGNPTAWVVATEIPAERLALLGLPYDPSDADRMVRAELLMQASGEVLAVRVLN